MRYLAIKKEEGAGERVAHALDILGSDDNFKTVCEYLLEPSIANADEQVRNMDHDNPQLPVFQGAGRTVAELLKISRDARMKKSL